ncbi:MAG TPA: P1 family peptidase [Pyrinomonadaceae bacterium]|nr:P1 family peptidase [Pyrinomonadaceae bacterium]
MRAIDCAIIRPLLVVCTLVSFGNSQPRETRTATPKVDKSGPSLTFDFPAMRVGVAEYDEGPTGTTVFYFPNGVKGAVDMRGGSPGELNAEILQNAYESRMVQAVVFSGGSWYGLSAATGVANGIKKMRAAEGNVDFIAGVLGAIIYDVGGRRLSRVTPDDILGEAALKSSEPGWFPLGARGAGRFAMQGVYFSRGQDAANYVDWPHSGQGGAFRTIGPTKIGVFTVVNALGAVVDRTGRMVRCGRNDAGQTCPLIADKIRNFPPTRHAPAETGGPTANTTITLVVTNQKLPFWALQRLATQVHSSMARAIQPFATSQDGDILYAVTTDEVENPALRATDLSVIASELAWDAVLASVPVIPERPRPMTTKPSLDGLRKYAGTYEFDGGGRLVVSAVDGSLTARFDGNGRIYFDKDQTYAVTPAENGRFIIESPGREVLRFDETSGRVTGLTLNPGPWAFTAVVVRRQVS